MFNSTKLKKMKNKDLKCFVRKGALSYLMFFSLSIFAQDIPVTGVVSSSDGAPLPGATIIEKGTSNGTQSDFDGNFSIKVSSNQATLVISYLGYVKHDVQLNGKTNLNVTLAEDAATLDEVVLIGYGSINKKNVTGAVAKINSSILEELPDVSFQNRLAGKLPGVTISQTTGAPGGNVNIRIRGIGSITGGNDPLIVIDGFPVSNDNNTSSTLGSRSGRTDIGIFENSQNTLSTLNPNDIQDVQVLKDAAAAAIYGSRGANGVILITTKKGAEGKPIFAFNASWGLQQVSKTYDMMDAYEFAKQHYVARSNAGTLSGYPSELIPYLNGVPGLVNTDWQDEIFRNAYMANYDISIKGGTKKTKYYISGNYSDQEGIVIGSGFKRYSMRTNIDVSLSDRLKVGINFNPSLSISDLVPAENPYFVDGIINTALLFSPTEPVYNPDGSFNFNQNTGSRSATGAFINPVAIATLYQDELKQARLLLGGFVEYDFLKHFKFKSQLSLDFGNWKRAIYRPSTIEARGTAGPSNPTSRDFTTQQYNWLTENTLTFDKTFNEAHNLSVLLGYTAQKNLRQRAGLIATDYDNDLVSTINIKNNTILSAYSANDEWALLSYLSRVMYDYKGKYLFSASLRRDGSSRFGANKKWGNFPSVSVGWRISDEMFFKSKTINDLKIRASYGERGNDGRSNYGSIARLGASNYVFDDTNVNGLAPRNASNPNLTWEFNSEFNYGLDVALFNNKFVLNADYFISTTKDLLYNIPVPSSSGAPGAVSFRNVSKEGIENRGFELGITNNLTFGKFKMTTSANIATLKNKILSFGTSDAPVLLSPTNLPDTYIAQIGQSVGTYYGYNVLGVFTTQDQLDNNAQWGSGGSFIGDFMYEDINGDNVINTDDRKIIGSYIPDYTFGFTSQMSYKNFNFSFAIQGKQNFEVLHTAQRYLGNLGGFSNYRSDSFRDAYISPSNPGNSQVYRPNASPTGGNANISSYHIEDGSYIRVQNITLGYSFNEDVLKNIGNLQKLRIYASAVNPFTFTDYPGYNPDVNSRPRDALTSGEDYGTYPLARNFLVGINLSF